eukprot:3675980-Prymnesium_polylepis.1
MSVRERPGAQTRLGLGAHRLEHRVEGLEFFVGLAIERSGHVLVREAVDDERDEDVEDDEHALSGGRSEGGQWAIREGEAEGTP